MIVMKILPTIAAKGKYICRNVKNTYTHINEVQKQGDEIARRASVIYGNEDKVSSYKRAMRIKKILKEITPYNLPVIGGVVGLISPIPGLSIVLFAAGTVVGAGMIIREKLKNNHQQT